MGSGIVFVFVFVLYLYCVCVYVYGPKKNILRLVLGKMKSNQNHFVLRIKTISFCENVRIGANEIFDPPDTIA